MKILNIPQNSAAELYCNLRHNWATKTYSSRKFDDITQKFPECLIESNSFGPLWGYAWYKKNKKGEITLFKENWDTSG